MPSLKFLITISLLQILASAAPILPRQIELLPVKGGGSGILNTLVGPIDGGMHTELQTLPIGKRNAQDDFDLELGLENTRVGPLNGQIYTELTVGETVVLEGK